MAVDLKPLAVPGATAPEPKPSTPTVPPVTTERESSISSPADTSPKPDAIDAWITEHPDTPESYEQVEVADAVVDAVNKPLVPPTASAEPTAADAPPELPLAEAQPVAQPAAAAEKPATPATPATLDANEQFEFAPGFKWSRGQIEGALRERGALQTESKTYRDLFGTDAATAKANWGPILSKLAEDPQRVELIDEYLGNAELQTYLNQCRSNYYEQTGLKPGARPGQPEQPAAVQLDPESRRQITELSAWKSQREATEAKDRLDREMGSAYQRYPILANDQGLVQKIFTHAKYLFESTGGQRGFADAVNEWSGYLDEITRARAGSAPVEAAPASVPALNGSAGASPSASRPARRRTGDAVDDWVSIDAPAAGFA